MMCVQQEQWAFHAMMPPLMHKVQISIMCRFDCLTLEFPHSYISFTYNIEGHT